MKCDPSAAAGFIRAGILPMMDLMQHRFPTLMAHILIVDDDAGIRDVLRHMLEDTGHHVFEVSNGLQAIGHLHRKAVDVVVCDIFMPSKDGLETIREIRRLFVDVGIVAMSGGGFGGTMDMLPAAKRFGACEVLYKPFEMQELHAVMERVLADR